MDVRLSILKLQTVIIWAFKSLPLYCRQSFSPFGLESGWVPVLVSMLWQREKPLFVLGNQPPVVRTTAVQCNGAHCTESVNCKLMQFIFLIHCLLTNFIKEKVEEAKRLRRWYKQLLNDLTENVTYRTLKAEATDRTLWRTRFGRICGPVARKLRNEILIHINYFCV